MIQSFQNSSPRTGNDKRTQLFNQDNHHIQSKNIDSEELEENKSIKIINQSQRIFQPERENISNKNNHIECSSPLEDSQFEKQEKKIFNNYKQNVQNDILIINSFSNSIPEIQAKSQKEIKSHSQSFKLINHNQTFNHIEGFNPQQSSITKHNNFSPLQQVTVNSKSKNWFYIGGIIAQFVKKTQMLKKLSKKDLIDYEIIDSIFDKSCDKSYYLIKQKKRHILVRLINCIKNCQIQFKVQFQILMLFYLLLNFLIRPYLIVNNQTVYQLLLFIDFIIGFLKMDELNKVNLKKNTNFALAFILLIQFYTSNKLWPQLLYFFKFTQLYRQYKNLNLNALINPLQSTLIQIGFYYFYLLHFFSCFQKLNNVQVYDLNKTIISIFVDDSDYDISYQISLKFMVYSLTICTIVLLQQAIMSQMAFENHIEQKLMEFIYNLKKQKVQLSLQWKIYSQLRKSIKKENEIHIKNSDLIPKLNKEVQIQMYNQIYSSLWSKSVFLKSILNDLNTSYFCSIIKEIQIKQNSIFGQDKEDDFKLYFLLEGQVDHYICCGNNFKVLTTFNRNCFIQEIEFFTQINQRNIFQAKTNCTLAYIVYSEFQKLVQSNKKNYEQLCMIRDSIRNQNFFTSIFKCHACHSTKHDYEHCPKIFYIPKKHKILKILGESFFQDRKMFQRYDNKKYHTLMNRNMIGITAVNFGISLNLFKESDADQMNKFHISNNNLDDIFQNEDERTSKQTIQTYINQTTFTNQSPKTINTNNPVAYQPSIGIKNEMNESQYTKTQKSNGLEKITKISNYKNSDRNSIIQQNEMLMRLGGQKIPSLSSSFEQQSKSTRKNPGVVNNNKSTSILHSQNNTISSPIMKNSQNSEYLLLNSEQSQQNFSSMRLFKQELEGLDSVQYYEYYFPGDNIDNIILKMK